MPPTEAMLMIEPPPSAIDACQASLVHCTMANWLTWTVFSALARSMSTIGPKYGFVPALLTSTSMAPNSATAASTQAAASSSLPTCAALASTPTSGCAVRISAATASSASCLREASTTLAPSPASAVAMAFPRPREAPVTSAVLPLSPVCIRPSTNSRIALDYLIRPTSRYFAVMDLSGAVAIITGAGSGIGAALARRFDRAGAAGLCLADLNGESAAAVAAGLSCPAVSMRTDVTDEEQVRAMVDT